MDYELSGPSYGVLPLRDFRNDSLGVFSLALISDRDGDRSLLSFGTDHMSRLRTGIPMDRLVTLEPATKAQRLFASSSRPHELYVSCVGGTLVLDASASGKLVEVEQGQTKIVQSEPSVYIGDCGETGLVQVTRGWVNRVSNGMGFLFRPLTSEKMVAAASSRSCESIFLGLGEGELRGRGRVVLLGLERGILSETCRKDVLQEVVDVGVVGEKFVVLLSDNSVHLLSGSLATLSQLVLNVPVKSLVVVSRETILVGTTTGLVCSVSETDQERLTLSSSRVLANEPVSLSLLNGGAVACTPSRQFFVTSTVQRIQLLDGVEGVVQIGNLVAAFQPFTGEVSLFRPPADMANVNNFFHRSAFSEINGGDLTASISLGDGDQLLLVKNSQPILIRHGQAFSCNLGKVTCAASHEGLLVTFCAHKSLLSLYQVDGGFSQVWEREFPLVQGMAIVRKDRLVVTLPGGEFRVYSLDVGSVGILKYRFLSEKFKNGENFLIHEFGKIFLVNSQLGVACLVLTKDGIMFTSVPNPPNPLSPITTFSVIDEHSIMTGSGDQILLHRIPSKPSPAASERMCMAATTAELIARTESKIRSLLHCGDSRRIVYFSSEGGQVGALVPRGDGGAANWFWD